MTPACAQCHRTFTIDSQDKTFYHRLAVPSPKFCPPCREQRRMLFRNERYYYQRNCDLCHKSMLSVYDPARTPNVYCLQCWWSDAWEAATHARPIDFTRPFFDQYQDLLNSVPRLAMMNDDGLQSDNCAYTYDFSLGKNAYMVIASWQVEDSMYGFQINRVKETYDSSFIFDSELIYEGMVVEKSYHCSNVTLVKNCRDIEFGFDLKGCSDCIACAGLRNKQYCIWNKQYTKADFDQKKHQLALHSFDNRSALKKQFADFITTIPRRYANLINCENTTGDNLFDCYNTQDSYLFNELVNCRYCAKGDKAKDCYDINSSGKPELCYDSITPDNSYNAMFTVFCWKSQFVWYSENCHSSSDLFGCVGLKKSKYCILNQAYSESEYNSLKAKLIAHMKDTGEYGEFFPMRLSPFAYNETPNQIDWPLQPAQALQLGATWQDHLPYVTGRQSLATIPDDINLASATIPQQILACEQCQRNYKIQAAEFNFYRKMQLPVPHTCVECRYSDRLQRINPRQLWTRQCMCTQVDHGHNGRCSTDFTTTYAPERKELVYCDNCYSKEIV